MTGRLNYYLQLRSFKLKKYILILLFLILLWQISVQGQAVHGNVSELNDNQETVPLPFVNVYWSGTQHGTVTDENGDYIISRHGDGDYPLVFSFVGYANDTLLVKAGQTEVDMVLTTGKALNEVTIAKRFGGSYISKLRPI